VLPATQALAGSRAEGGLYLSEITENDALLRPGDLVHRVVKAGGFVVERQTGQVVFSGMDGNTEVSLVNVSNGCGLQWGDGWLRHGRFVAVVR
jgi:hypothetical protein